MADVECFSLKTEAAAAIKEIKFAVNRAKLSESLASNAEKVYFNVETQETQHFCIELTTKGFRLVGRKFDVIDLPGDNGYFETIYALLDVISPLYRKSFGSSLIHKLQRLKDIQDKREAKDT